MSDYNYSMIRRQVMNWYTKNLSNLEEIFISEDTDSTLVIDFEFEKCIASLIVSEPDNNPYQCIYFIAFDIESKNKIYDFYDDETLNLKDIDDALDEAYNYCVNYRVSE